MAKITLENGVVIEGTIEELKQMGMKFPVEAEERSPKYTQIDGGEVRVGDFVKFENGDYGIVSGKYYEIISFDSEDDANFIDEDGDRAYVETDADDAEFYRLAARELEEQAEEVAVEEPKPLKVGDYAKVVKDTCGHGFSTGDVLRITELFPNGEVHRAVDVFSGDERSIGNKGELIRATDEEVAAAKAQAEAKREADRWAKIGRKPGEVKVGDIVRIMEKVGGHSVGAIGKVTEVKNPGRHENRVNVISQSGEWAERNVELITPVESRFDLAMDGDQDDAK